MLVDDDETDLFINEKIIKVCGITERVVSHRNGELALNYMKNNIGKPESLPNYIFLDLNMPIMNGTTFMNHFENLPENVKDGSKIIILSSSNDYRDKERFKNNKYVLKYLTKPLSEENLNLIDNNN